MIENRVLNYFLAIAREQNMTKAASQLHISQSALSKQISDLENQLGIKLFTRTNKSTLLTDAGILFRIKAQEMIDLMNKVESEFSIEGGEVSGDIHLGCAETYIMEHISKIFKNIQMEYPNIRFHIYSGDAESILERLDKGLLDIGLLLGPVKHEKFNYKELELYDTFGILMPNDAPLALNDTVTFYDLQDMPIILSAQTARGLHNIPKFDNIIQELNVVGTYNLISNATYMVEQGIGYAMCLDKLVNTKGRNLVFRPFSPEIKIDSYIVTKNYAYHSKAIKILLSRI